MMTDIERLQVEGLLAQPDRLLRKKPFYRKIERSDRGDGTQVTQNGTVSVSLPDMRKVTVSQETFARELDVYSHDVLFDDNLPSITIKLKDGGYMEIKQTRMGIPFQVLIRDKQVRHLCVNRVCHTLLNTDPSEKEQENFTVFKQMWDSKNQEGYKTKMVQDQKSYGDAGLLYFMGDDGKLHNKSINYDDGYVIITHKNDYGKHILECLYYAVEDYEGNKTVYLDCYDDEKMTRFTQDAGADDVSGWTRHNPVFHGFSECPLITKRGDVAWNRGQTTITAYESLYNVFVVIQKKHGWGIIYVKGKFNQNGQRLAGNVILNDTTMDPAADAKVLNPATVDGIIETLKAMKETIMISCGTTFILPDDIKISGDTSGLAVEMTQELDMATAQDGVIEWQNVASKMSRLFKEGIAMELVNSGKKEYEHAVTDFENLRIHSEFQVWKPKSEEGHNQMLATLKGAGGISQQTLVEKNTVSTPDELRRIQKEHEAQIKEQEQQAEKAAALAKKTSENDSDNKDTK